MLKSGKAQLVKVLALAAVVALLLAAPAYPTFLPAFVQAEEVQSCEEVDDHGLCAQWVTVPGQ